VFRRPSNSSTCVVSVFLCGDPLLVYGLIRKSGKWKLDLVPG